MENRLFAHRLLALLAALMLGACAAPAPSVPAADEYYVIVVSFDGFRHDFASLAETPAIDRMAHDGLRAQVLQPAFPTVTFPNHFSIATGMLPQHHGIVANDFPGKDGDWYSYKDRSSVQDGRWYLAEPFWVTAEKAGMRAAAYYFVGTEADAGGVRPTYWRPFDASVPGQARVKQVLDWLRAPVDTRPRVITLYFEDVDTATHDYGIGSRQSLQAIRRVDAYLDQLQQGIGRLPIANRVSIVLVSDHGMADYSGSEPLVVDEWVDLERTRIVEGGPYVMIWFEQPDAARASEMRDELNRHWDCGQAMRPADLPAEWRASPSPRHPDLWLVAEPGCAVISTGQRRNKLQAADHGWPPDDGNMGGILYATGPRIPAGLRTGPVHVTDVQPLVLELLGLPAPTLIDGDATKLTSLLEPQKR